MPTKSPRSSVTNPMTTSNSSTPSQSPTVSTGQLSPLQARTRPRPRSPTPPPAHRFALQSPPHPWVYGYLGFLAEGSYRCKSAALDMRRTVNQVTTQAVAEASGTFTLGGDLTVNRLGF